MSGWTSPQQVLEEVFGYGEFRGEQAAIIDEVVAGRDALVLMPTGGGKSLCYQIPALLRPGVGVVVSPLIALMEDQVSALVQLGVRVACLNSTQDSADRRAAERALAEGELDLVYVAPERLFSDRFARTLMQTQVALIAIDEAHCISQWGHDFRAEYLRLGELCAAFPDVPRIALTATADQPTREEIVERLSLGQARQFVASFDRPNIRYEVTTAPSPKKRMLELIQRRHPGEAGIVYCLSRKKTEEVANWLSSRGVRALPYHAGLSNEQRRENQRRFIHEEGLVVCATIAFGMGIDKPNVRFVAHLDLPKSLEHYYQETGRAGRDGLPSSAWLAYGLSSVVGLRKIMESGNAPERQKRIERHKLNAMLGFCEASACRRAVLLRYFGEDYEAGEDGCGNCDLCLQPVETYDGTRHAQMALSAVYRTDQRFGVGHLLDVLGGKSTARVQQFGHDRLKLFGVGKEIHDRQWRSIYRQLVAAGLVGVDVSGYGGLYLTEGSTQVLKGELPVRLRRDPTPSASDRGRSRRSRAAAQDAGPLLDSSEQKLFEQLRERRLELAREQGVPPYVIFSDRTLQELASRRPTDLTAMRQINGIGEYKLTRYGRAFLELLDA